MQSLDNFRELIKETLLNNNGDIKLREHKEITDYAKQVGFDDRMLSRLIQDIDSGINWTYIKQQKELLAQEKSNNQNSAKNSKKAEGFKIVETRPVKTTINIPMPVTPKTQKTKLFIGKLIFITGFVTLISITIIKGLMPIAEKGTTMFSYVDVLDIRSSPDTTVANNIINRVLYGDSIKVLSIDSGWAYCIVTDKKGYVATKYLLDKKSFYKLDCIFADRFARELIKHSYHRYGLLKYYDSKGFMGNMDIDLQMELFGGVQQKDIWQLITAPSSSYYNSAIYPNLNSESKYSSVGCIIKNIQTGHRQFVLLGFKYNGEPFLLYEADAPRKGNIKSVSKSAKGEFKVNYSK